MESNEETNEKDKKDMEKNFPKYMNQLESQKEKPKQDLVSELEEFFSGDSTNSEKKEEQPVTAIPEGMKASVEMTSGGKVIKGEMPISAGMFKRRGRPKLSPEALLRRKKRYKLKKSMQDKKRLLQLKADPIKYQEYLENKRKIYQKMIATNPGYLKKLSEKNKARYKIKKHKIRAKAYSREYQRRVKAFGKHPDMSDWDYKHACLKTKKILAPLIPAELKPYVKQKITTHKSTQIWDALPDKPDTECLHNYQELITCIICRKCGKMIKK